MVLRRPPNASKRWCGNSGGGLDTPLLPTPPSPPASPRHRAPARGGSRPRRENRALEGGAVARARRFFSEKKPTEKTSTNKKPPAAVAAAAPVAALGPVLSLRDRCPAPVQTAAAAAAGARPRETSLPGRPGGRLERGNTRRGPVRKGSGLPPPSERHRGGLGPSGARLGRGLRRGPARTSWSDRGRGAAATARGPGGGTAAERAVAAAGARSRGGWPRGPAAAAGMRRGGVEEPAAGGAAGRRGLSGARGWRRERP